MKTVCVACLHQFYEAEFGISDGGTEYGNRYMNIFIQLKKHLELKGVRLVSRAQFPIEQADAVIFWDMSPLDIDLQKSLRGKKTMILTSTESPLFAPLSHSPNIVQDPSWFKVITWNRSITGKNIVYFDIPSNSQTILSSFPQKKFRPDSPAVVMKSYHFDLHTDSKEFEIRFLLRLIDKGWIDVYGKNWPTEVPNTFGVSPNKIKTFLRYDYTFSLENCMIPGFVTEKIADAILAGLPSIYYGDYENAQRRYPGCFVHLPELTLEAYEQARNELINRYEELRENVKKSYDRAILWNENFLQSFEKALLDVFQTSEVS
jgi:hypothetical protein